MSHEFASAELTVGELNALVKKVGGAEVVRSIFRGTVELTFKQRKKLLVKVAEVQVVALSRFCAKDYLKSCNVGWTGDNFRKLFLGDVEENVADTTVAIHRLEQASLDPPIMAQLADRAELKLTHFFELLKKQSKGESGVLLTNGYANVAYIKGNDGNLWAVSACWRSYCGYYWNVEANSVGDPYRWDDGYQILSRDS